MYISQMVTPLMRMERMRNIDQDIGDAEEFMKSYLGLVSWDLLLHLSIFMAHSLYSSELK